MLDELQSTHDDARNWGSTADMRDALKYVAENYALNSAILDTLSFADGR